MRTLVFPGMTTKPASESSGRPAEAHLPRSGEVVAHRYRLSRLLGTGGHGSVFEAERTDGLGPCAVKFLNPGSAPDKAPRRLLREAELTSRLQHPNTVRLFDVGTTDQGVPFVAMELVRGETLEARLRRSPGGRLTEAEVLTLARGLLGSLAEAHALGIVHRDLKPSNLMLASLGDETHLKVVDFGVAWCDGSSLTDTGHALGTPAYMSPEQCQGAAVDGRSDLYAVGCILYRCLSGRCPFADPNPMTVMFGHAHAMPTDLRVLVPDLSARMAQAIAQAMEKLPERRFADASRMRQALSPDPTVESLPLAGETLDTRPVVPRSAWRAPAWFALGAALASSCALFSWHSGQVATQLVRTSAGPSWGAIEPLDLPGLVPPPVSERRDRTPGPSASNAPPHTPRSNLDDPVPQRIAHEPKRRRINPGSLGDKPYLPD